MPGSHADGTIRLLAIWGVTLALAFAATFAHAITLTAVQSRKFHGAAGTFDLPIDTTQNIGGPVTVEPRAIGAGHQIVFQFDVPITASGIPAAFDEAGAAVGALTASAAGNDVVVTLTGVPDNKRVTVHLSNVNGAGVGVFASLGFLVGDVNGSRSVTATDILQVKGRSGQVTNATNFTFDLNASGSITASDILAVKGRSGLVLPAAAIYTLSVSKTGTGSGTVTSSPAGINCGAVCTGTYTAGTVVTVAATPSAGSTLSAWGGACSGTGTCVVTMDAAKSVFASFTVNCGATTCFIELYAADGSLPPSPTSSKLAISTQLQKGDVGFIVDTTGSMGGEIAALKANLSATIIPALKAKIPSLGVGVAAHDDVPYNGYGSAGCDLPFYFPATPQGYVTTITADSQFAANALTIHCGSDASEAQVPAIYHAITGSGITWPGGSVAAAAPPAGTFGAMHFRSDALPIVINITDISHHNGKRALDKTGTSYDTAYQDPYSFSTYNVDDVVAKMNSIGAKFIGVSADNGLRAMGTSDPYGYHAYITDKTNSNVPPSAFTGGTCNTGLSGAAVAADGPTIAGVTQCRSVFSIGTIGTGLSTSIVDGVVAVLNTVKFDVYVQAYNDAAETTDVVGNFMLKVEPDPTGGTDLVTGRVCLAFPGTQLSDYFTGPKALVAAADGVNDTIRQVNPGPLYCFNVIPKANKVIAATAYEQTFRAWLRVLAMKPTGGTFVLGPDREVNFIIPPIVN
jgi:hypothetical protein